MEKISDEVKEEIEEMDEAETQFLTLSEPAGSEEDQLSK